MAGSGQRFVDAGYTDPKPMIPLADPKGKKRIIEHVVGMFAPTDEFVFICNSDHPGWMVDVIYALCPKAKILVIPPHKRGPVWTVKAAYSSISASEEVIVSYCDGAIRWDREVFDRYVQADQIDGCLLTHTGFHPHTLSTTKMAFVRETDGLVKEVREKASFTGDPLSEHASSGVYYFRRGEDLKHYFDRALEEDVSYNGECYVTLVYNLMIKDGLRVGYFDTKHVAILGTPGEVRNYEAWATILKGEQVKNSADALRVFNYWREYHRC